MECLIKIDYFKKIKYQISQHFWYIAFCSMFEFLIIFCPNIFVVSFR